MIKFIKSFFSKKAEPVVEVAPYKVEVSQQDPLKRAVEPIAAGTVTPEIVVTVPIISQPLPTTNLPYTPEVSPVVEVAKPVVKKSAPAKPRKSRKPKVAK